MAITIEATRHATRTTIMYFQVGGIARPDSMRATPGPNPGTTRE
jgi:hypothetical protein